MTYSYKCFASNQIAVFAQRFLGLPQGKHCYLLERNVRRKVAYMSKKRFWRKIIAFFDAVLSEMDLGNVDTREV